MSNKADQKKRTLPRQKKHGDAQRLVCSGCGLLNIVRESLSGEAPSIRCGELGQQLYLLLDASSLSSIFSLIVCVLVARNRLGEAGGWCLRHFPTSDEQAPAGGEEEKRKVSSIAGEGDTASFVDAVAVCNEGKGPRCWMGGTACSEVAEGMTGQRTRTVTKIPRALPATTY